MLMPEFIRKLHKAGLKRYLATGQQHIRVAGNRVSWIAKERRGISRGCVSFGEVNKEGRHIFTGFLRDIGERKRAEEELEAAFRPGFCVLQDEERRQNRQGVLHDSTGPKTSLALANHASVNCGVQSLRARRKSRRLHLRV